VRHVGRLVFPLSLDPGTSLCASGPLLMVMTGRAVNTCQQTTMYTQSPNSSTSSDGVAAGRLSSNIPSGGSMTVSVFVGGENYETTKAETTISL
jgi:hypothetical protein